MPRPKKNLTEEEKLERLNKQREIMRNRHHTRKRDMNIVIKDRFLDIVSYLVEDNNKFNEYVDLSNDIVNKNMSNNKTKIEFFDMLWTATR